MKNNEKQYQMIKKRCKMMQNDENLSKSKKNLLNYLYYNNYSIEEYLIYNEVNETEALHFAMYHFSKVEYTYSYKYNHKISICYPINSLFCNKILYWNWNNIFTKCIKLNTINE
jgi:hypothetical protein